MDRQEERLGQEEGASEATRRRGRPPRQHPEMDAGAQAGLSPDELLDTRMETEADMSEGFDDGIADLEDEKFLEVFLDSLNQTVLPRLPDLPGHHVCWLSTTNARDSIEWRQRVGYRLLRYSDFSDLTSLGGVNVSEAKPDDLIRINEMVAAKIPTRLYQKLMAAVHHHLPLQEEQKLHARLQEMADQAQRSGARLEAGDGTRDIVQAGRGQGPVFAA